MSDVLTPSLPQTLGLKRSFGFGDRLGVGTPGHIAAVREHDFAPVFAQQSIREMTRTGRAPEDVIATAARAVESEGWDGLWGADADHIQTKEDAERTAKAGFTLFTIDPSAHVSNTAGHMDGDALREAYGALVDDGTIKRDEAFDLYLGRAHSMGEAGSLTFVNRTELLRTVVKYAGAVAYARRMHGWIGEACGSRSFEMEISVDDTDVPTSPLDHLFIGLELKRAGVNVVSLAPRFVGDFEKGSDYRGDLDLFAEQYAFHAAIARYCGPYKISIHSGSDKFKIYPIIGRLSGELLHVKTAGTSYLEALRVVARTDQKLFKELAALARDRYDADRASYFVSAKVSDLPARIDNRNLEKRYLDTDAGREIMHVTYGSILNGTGSDGGAFRSRIMENLIRNGDLYKELLTIHLGKHLKLLSG